MGSVEGGKSGGPPVAEVRWLRPHHSRHQPQLQQRSTRRGCAQQQQQRVWA